MSEIQTLYQDLILDHNKNPRNFRKIENADRFLEGYNPLCGDRYTVYVKLNGDIVDDISFVGSGCAISKASASVMTSMLKGKTIHEAQELFTIFHKLVTGEHISNQEREKLGKLEVFSGVSAFPTRVKCASLPWHTLKGIIEDKNTVVSTE
ncbi:MAG: SUF system NifU family Fe-S cluster assembly protein [Bacteroidetes bacterium]|nr:SUF system NifU family Fe-S cluster assembly protein [Bacteroidota bacterium]